MSEFPKPRLPPEQQAIRDKCFHPSGHFIEFPKEDVETSIPDRFEKIARRFPDRIAVKTTNGTLTYQELNHAANRLAHVILAQRGEAQEPVALLTEHDTSLLVAILGVLKAGKICVVLDPKFPKTRNAFLLEDSQAALLITDSKNLSLAREYAYDRPRLVNVDELDSGFSIDSPGLTLAPDHFAFLIYTSGSTGQPKGVIQNHRNLLHDSLLYCNGLHICTDDRIALLYSCSASQGLKITLAALLNGAALYPFNVQQKGVANLGAWLDREGITIYFSIPIVFRHFVSTITGKAQLPSLRIIQLGSDLVTRREIDDYQKYFYPNTILIIRFGTTETGTLRRMFFDVKTPLEEATVPVGYAIEDTDISLLDEAGKEVRFDGVGEIVVNSRYVSPGYWQRPDLTQENFFPDPNEDDKRIYRTGDLGQLRSEGLLYHLGRKDFQLNIRGYRVEAGEIEAVLLAQGNVKEAVVATGKTSTGAESDRLIAYIVPLQRPSPSIPALRRAVGNKLPAYMIPSDFVFLESLPRTPNGKIDRRALQAPGNARPDLDVTYVVPQSDIEKQLVRIWEEILEVRPIGIHDNFLDLGGHSLSATRLVSQVIKNFQLEIPAQSLFQSPTVAEMAVVISEHEKSELAREKGDGGVTMCSLGDTPRNEAPPLSFAQQRMWFLHQLEPESPAYNQFKALRLQGRLDSEALRKALDTIVERHEVLRTTFSLVDGQPAQIVHRPGTVEMSAIGMAGIPIEQREEILQRTLQEFVRRPFDLEKAWPLRAALIQLSDEEHLLVFVTHHIASDGWSNSILFTELSALYEAYCQKNASPFTDLPIQYADYAAWQRESLEGEVLQQQLAYWEKQLKDISPLELPTDRPRPAVSRHLGRTKTFALPQVLAESLKSLSRQEGATLFMTLLAGFQTLLHRYTGQEDIAVGCPIAGRERVELERLIGFFVNTLVLRNDFSGNPTFRELLERVRTTALDAYDHQKVPFEKIVAELQPARDFSRNPFFQVIFQLRNYPAQSVSAAELNIEDYEFGTGIAKFDLSVGLRDNGNGLSGTVEYSTDLFDQTTIERMVAQFQTLLEGIVRNPEQRISELPLLREAEKQQLLVEWNDTKRDYPKDKCIHELFETQVEKTPDAIALVFEDQQIHYRELNNRANQLAHYLRKLGVGPETLVGICMERSIEMIVGLLGILKAGGAYVPLDPSYPKERIAFMIGDSQAPVVLAQNKLLEQLPTLSLQNRTICLDTGWQTVARESAENLTSGVRTENLAYVIYTSGSTGKPKGVMVEHRSLVNYLCWFSESFVVEKALNLPVTTRLTFDASLKQLFPPLLHGRQLFLVSDEVINQPAKLIEAIRYRDRFSMNCVPSLWNAVLDAIESDPGLVPPAALFSLLLGGENPGRQLLEKTFAAFPGLDLWNLYGPTEATVNATIARLHPDGPIIIGRPIANTQVYILDPHLNPVPIGVAGEIHIAGHGLARGYWSRPELTTEKFISSPFSDTPEARLYKTGDIARYLPDGNIEFLGRIDDQVKIRGYRIELGEIETVLGQHPAIQQTVVLPRKDSPGDVRLVAYIVAAADTNPSAHDLRGFLQQKLPDYMVPSAFMFLESLPLTPNGKLDRKALPTPDQSRPELEEAYTTPRTPTEVLLAGIWAMVLKLDKVGIHDNFFELGGHSLLATQLISRIRDAFRLDLPLRKLFEAPTIYGLAQRVQELGEKQGVVEEAKINRLGREHYRVQQTK